MLLVAFSLFFCLSAYCCSDNGYDASDRCNNGSFGRKGSYGDSCRFNRGVGAGDVGVSVGSGVGEAGTTVGVGVGPTVGISVGVEPYCDVGVGLVCSRGCGRRSG